MLGLFWMQCKRKNLIYSFADSSVIGDKHLLANSGDVCILLKPNECQKFLRQLCFSMHKYAFPSNFFSSSSPSPKSKHRYLQYNTLTR